MAPKYLIPVSKILSLFYLYSGIWMGRSSTDNVFPWWVDSGCMRNGVNLYFFLDAKKGHDAVWKDGLGYKMWEMDIKGKMYRVVNSLYIYVNNRCLIFFGGGLLNFLQLILGAQGCTFLVTLLLICMNDLLCEIEKCLCRCQIFWK